MEGILRLLHGQDLNASFFKPHSHQRHSPLAAVELRLLIRGALGSAQDGPEQLLLAGSQHAEFRLQQGLGSCLAWFSSPLWLPLIQPSVKGPLLELQGTVATHCFEAWWGQDVIAVIGLTKEEL